MGTVTRVVQASPMDVWAVLADGWSYSGFVVGTARIRAVDENWPQEGSRIHHSFGSWPALIDDSTTVVHCEPGHRITLEARGWPLGQATVHFDIEPHPLGASVSLHEDASTGPGRWLVPQPVRDALIDTRNRETLRRIALRAERSTSDQAARTHRTKDAHAAG